MSKKVFIEIVPLAASCLAPGSQPSRHLLDMLWKRLEVFKGEYPELIKLMMPIQPATAHTKEVRVINEFWLRKFCTSLYDGLYMLELEAEEFVPPEPEPEPPTTMTVGDLIDSLQEYPSEALVRGVRYQCYSEWTSTETDYDICGVCGDVEDGIQIQLEG